MNNEEKILAILETVQAEQRATNKRLDTMDGRFDRLETKVDRIESEVSDIHREQAEMKQEVASISGTVVRIEQEHGKKLDALFDGYQQVDGKVSRIEKHVSSQDDMILKRVFPKAME